MSNLNAKSSVLLLIDFQGGVMDSVVSSDKRPIISSALACITAAKLLGVPIVLTSTDEERNGTFLPEMTSAAGVEAIERAQPNFDAFLDAAVMRAIKATRARQIVIAGIWTSVCAAFSALHAMDLGYQVFSINDALGDCSKQAHRAGEQRMFQGGVIPMTWSSITSAWMGDWNNPKSGLVASQVFGKFM